ncbi:VOC family protein [Micromonospora sp. NPDC000089]|uniref:VOC family protein n=1 Tax=unclassified Micromonospora TaxID=2617518 RepID=UPI00368FFA24
MTASLAPAVPGRVTLVTPDPDAARAFHAELLGWTYAGDTALASDGQPAADLLTGQGPARWWTTFAAADPHAVLAAAEKAGARVDGAEVHDPYGGSFRVDAAASAAAPGPGHPVWYEYMTTTPAEADRFHAEVLGLPATVPPGAPDDSYAILLAGGRPVAGRLTLPPPMAALLPAGWMVYFAVGDPDGAAERVDGLGGRVLVPPRDVATGRIACVADPTGAVSTLIRPAAQG